MSNYTNVLILLLRMRQACSHPSLLTSKYSADDLDAVPDTNLDKPSASPSAKSRAKAKARPSTGSTAPELDDELEGLIGSLGGLTVDQRPACPLCAKPVGIKQEGGAAKAGGYCDACEAKYAAFEGLQFSTKVRRCLDLLEAIRTQPREPSPLAPSVLGAAAGRPLAAGTFASAAVPHKTIVFSQFTSFFDVLQPFLRRANVGFVRLDGSMNARQRDVALDRIRRPDGKYVVILVSIKAGSVGLNLTCCSRVILMDLWWNPAIEAQAFDRSHRFGQERDVEIYKVTIDGTIEDRILALQHDKAELAKAALDGGDVVKGNKLSMKDILALFKRDGGDQEGREA